MALEGAPDPRLVRALAPLIADPEGSVLLFDFDGTLSPIVDRPDQARPTPGVIDLLDQLTKLYRTVGVVSGRPVSFLAEHLPPSLVLSGQYGLESIVDGERLDLPDADEWRSAVDLATAMLEDAVPAGALVEPKGLSLTVHYRGRTDLADEVGAAVADVAEATGLVKRAAKMSVELVPPLPTSKAEVVRRWGTGARGVLFVGDDVGDLPGFEALEALQGGVTTHVIGLAVGTPELPDAVREAADLVLDGPDAVVDVLAALLG